MQLATRERLDWALVLYLVIAWRILHLVTLGRKGDGNPGPKALWEGLLKLMAYVEAFQATREVYGEG